jgi:hypothetical protein
MSLTMPGRKWLEVAETLLTRHSSDGPVCAASLARECGLVLFPSKIATAPEVDDGYLVYPYRLHGARRSRALLEGVAEFALRSAGEPVHDISKRAVMARLLRGAAQAPRRHRARREDAGL